MADETNAQITLPSPEIQPAGTGQTFEITRAPAVVPDPGTAALAPQTAAAFAGTGRGAKSFGLIPTFEERATEPGTPLDKETGLTTWDRLQLARRSAEQDQFAYLKNKYGDKIRQVDGQWIVRVPDEATGAEKDIVANPHKLTVGDLGALAGHTPEIAEWVLGEKALRAIPMLGRMKGIGGVVRDVVGGAAGAETGGGLMDIETRLEDRRPLDLGEILGRRAGGFVADVGVGLPLMGAMKFVNWTRSPFGGLATDVQFDMVAAQKEFYQKTGILVPLNLAEISGNPDIAARFRQLKRYPGSAEPMAEFAQRQDAAMKKLQDIMVGTDVADEAKLGQQAIGAAETKLQPLIAEEAAARSGVAEQGTADIQATMASRTTPLSRQGWEVGEMIRTRLTNLRDAAKAQADKLFGDFRSITGDNPIISGEELAKAAEKIKKDAASAFRPKQELTFNPETGQSEFQPSSTELVQESGKAFVPETSVMRRLDEMIANKGATYRFSDLQKMRAEVFDDLAKSEAVPGMGAHYLSRIGGALTEAMEKGVAAIPDPAAKSALEAANKFYKENVVPFSKKGINEIFKNEFEPGYIFPGKLAEAFTSGAEATDRYMQLQKFLGPASGEMRMLNRHIADSVLQQGQLLGAETLDAKTFLRNLSNFVNDKPEIAKQVFGNTQAKLVETAKVMTLAAENDKLPVDEVAKLVASGKADTSSLQKLMRAQAALDDKTSNSILDAIKRKTVTGLDVSAEDIVTRWIPKASRGEIEQFMSMLADRPALTDDIRSLYAQKLLAKASETGKPVTDVLAKAYGDEKGKLLLGDKLMEDLQRFGALQKGIGAAKGGDIGASMASAGRLDKALVKPLTFLPQALREWVTAKVLTSDTMRNWALNPRNQEPGNIMLVLSSPPFVRAVADTFGTGSKAQNVMQSIHQGLGDWFKNNVAQQKADEQMNKRFEATKPKTMELPKMMFGPKGGAGFVGTNQPPAQP